MVVKVMKPAHKYKACNQLKSEFYASPRHVWWLNWKKNCYQELSMVRTWKKDVTRWCELHVWINSRDIPARYIPNDSHKDESKHQHQICFSSAYGLKTTSNFVKIPPKWPRNSCFAHGSILNQRLLSEITGINLTPDQVSISHNACHCSLLSPRSGLWTKV